MKMNKKYFFDILITTKRSLNNVNMNSEGRKCVLNLERWMYSSGVIFSGWNKFTCNQQFRFEVVFPLRQNGNHLFENSELRARKNTYFEAHSIYWN